MEKLNWPADFVNQVICGGCLQVLEHIPDDSIDLVVTDPPYDLDINYHEGGIAARENVRVFKDIQHAFGNGFDPSDLLHAVARTMKVFNGYFWCSVRQLHRYIEFAKARGLIYDVLSWHKNNPMPLTNNGHLPDTEFCVFMRQAGATFNNGLPVKTYTSYWVTARQMRKGHPTPKPIEIMRIHVELSSKPGDIVLDPFAGSGTTLAAAKERGRRLIGIDINAKYCDLARDRVSQEVLI